MKDLDEFLPQILPFAPGCPVPVAFDHIRSAAQILSEQARIWRDTITVTIDDIEKSIVAPNGAVLYEIERAKFDGRTIDPASTDFIDDKYTGWEDPITNGLTGAPAYVTQTDLNTVRVLPYQAGTLILHAFLKPAEDATQLPDFFIDQYRRVVADGALAEILVLPKQNFTDPARAQFFENRFMKKIDKLSNHNVRGQQRAPSRTVASFF